eukprot:TRINITY_DN33001_c0_g1_i1.p1 TRINITY_DN33001_c0_g1~~TRINITY_DN33001_c0_g1_i1.p1  ORF type:complete len:443 (-),score=39.52 TRINITY_DN33001_c0_g1_i1:33-1361(-)
MVQRFLAEPAFAISVFACRLSLQAQSLAQAADDAEPARRQRASEAAVASLVAEDVAETADWTVLDHYAKPWGTHSGCAEIVRRFDFLKNHSDLDLNFRRYHACVERRSELPDWHSHRRPSLLSGEHYPVAVTPSVRSPPNYWVTPAWDYVVSNFVRNMGTFEPGELSLLKALTGSGDTICDIGAHIGSYAIPLASHVGRKGVVHAIEPFRLVYQLLIANVAINGLSNVFGHNVALADVTERRKVLTPSLTQSSNIGATRVFDQTPPHFKKSNVLQYAEEEEVQVRTLDSLELQRVDLIKVDVEGALERVLKGAVETVSRHRPVFAVEHDSDSAPELLLEWDYLCVKVMPVHNIWVCVPQEKWRRHKWVETASDGSTHGPVVVHRRPGLAEAAVRRSQQPTSADAPETVNALRDALSRLDVREVGERPSPAARKSPLGIDLGL